MWHYKETWWWWWWWWQTDRHTDATKRSIPPRRLYSRHGITNKQQTGLYKRDIIIHVTNVTTRHKETEHLLTYNGVVRTWCEGVTGATGLLSQSPEYTVLGRQTSNFVELKVNWKKLNSWTSRGHVPHCPSWRRQWLIYLLNQLWYVAL